MKRSRFISIAFGFLVLALSTVADEAARGKAKASNERPKHFPHRIWAACDFESAAVDYGWFGLPDTNNIPFYPGNRTSLRAESRKSNSAGIFAGINPVPGPRMGKENYLYVRYLLKRNTSARFQYFSLTSEDNNHIEASGLVANKWAECTLNFTRDGKRNDGTPGVPFKEGERMDDLKIYVEGGGKSGPPELWIDDVIFFANDPSLPPESEPFPRRVIHLAAFDTGPKEKYWPGDYEITETDLPPNSHWRVARAVPRKDGKGKLVSLPINPVEPVGEHTKLRFRYYLSGAAQMTVQIFDATVQDNRHIHLRNLKQNSWETIYLDFARDSRRNDGSEGSFKPGNLVDDIFFFVEAEGGKSLELLLDEVILFDAEPKTD